MTVVLVLLPILTHSPTYWALTIAVPIALAVWYLYGYHRTNQPTRAGEPVAEESFDDPVEAADRQATEAARARALEEDDEVEKLATAPVTLPDDDEPAA